MALLIIGLQINPTIGAVPYWLGIGWFSHLFYDYKTQGGIVLFYPISLYTTETLGDTEFIAPMHFFGYWVRRPAPRKRRAASSSPVRYG